MDGGQQPIDPETLNSQPNVPHFQEPDAFSANRPPPLPDFLNAMNRLNMNPSLDMNAEFERMRRELHQQYGHNDDDSDEGEGMHHGHRGNQRAVEYDEFGVRRPDPVKIQRLISDERLRYDDEREIFGRVDDPSVDWFFEPPRALNSIMSLEQVTEITSI